MHTFVNARNDFIKRKYCEILRTNSVIFVHVYTFIAFVDTRIYLESLYDKKNLKKELLRMLVLNCVFECVVRSRK